MRKFISFLILLTFLAGCSPLHQLEKRANHAFRQHDWDTAVALYSKLIQERPDDIELQSRFWWARLKASQTHWLKAKTLRERGDLEKALVEYELAVDLDPTNGDLRNEFENLKKELQGKQVSPPMYQPEKPRFDTDVVLHDEKLALRFEKTPLKTILESIARVENLQLILDPDLSNPELTIDLHNLTLRKALDTLGKIARFIYIFPTSKALLVAPDTPQKRNLLKTYYGYTFHIEYGRAQSIYQMIRSALRLNYVGYDSHSRTITVVGTRDQIEAVAQMIAQIDIPPGEILLQIDILEVNRSALQEYGLRFVSGASSGIDTALTVNPQLELDPGPVLSRSDFTIVNFPGLVARLLKQSGQSRLLASIPIRTIEGTAGSVSFGTDVPVPQTTFVPIATGGVEQQPVTSFQYRTVGLNIELTPYLQRDGTILLEVHIESSSIAGTGYADLPLFATSKIEKTIRLKKGEISLIAGLFREQLQKTKESIPGLEYIPILGQLLQKEKTEKTETEIVVLITPYILREKPVLPEQETAFRYRFTEEPSRGGLWQAPWQIPRQRPEQKPKPDE